MRLFLEQALPGTVWSVQETHEGDWTSYTNGVMYTISGGDVSWRDRWQDDADYGERYARLEVRANNQYSMIMPSGHFHCGRLTEDGFLVWDEGSKGEWKWFRAGKMSPPALVCQDRNLRVHIFDRESVVEQMEKERLPEGKEQDSSSAQQKVESTHESEWVWFRKELHRVWSELGEANCGTFGAHNTLLLDEVPEACSHPGNVITLPRWSWHEDGSGMVSLCQYLRCLIAAQPDRVADYLCLHPCHVFNEANDTEDYHQA